jgi:hypothetical protein
VSLSPRGVVVRAHLLLPWGCHHLIVADTNVSTMVTLTVFSFTFFWVLLLCSFRMFWLAFDIVLAKKPDMTYIFYIPSPSHNRMHIFSDKDKNI